MLCKICIILINGEHGIHTLPVSSAQTQGMSFGRTELAQEPSAELMLFRQPSYAWAVDQTLWVPRPWLNGRSNLRETAPKADH